MSGGTGGKGGSFKMTMAKETAYVFGDVQGSFFVNDHSLYSKPEITILSQF